MTLERRRGLGAFRAPALENRLIALHAGLETAGLALGEAFLCHQRPDFDHPAPGVLEVGLRLVLGGDRLLQFEPGEFVVDAKQQVALVDPRPGIHFEADDATLDIG